MLLHWILFLFVTGASYGYAGTRWVGEACGCWGLDAIVLLQPSFTSRLASQCSWGTYLEKQLFLCISMLAAGWRVALPCSCFTPGYIFPWTEVISLYTAGLWLGVWHSGKWVLCPSAHVKSNPGQGLTGTRTIIVPLFSWFSFCPSSAEILLTYSLSAGRPWKRARCTSAQGTCLGSGAEGAIQLWDHLEQHVLFCLVYSAECEGFCRVLLYSWLLAGHFQDNLSQATDFPLNLLIFFMFKQQPPITHANGGRPSNICWQSALFLISVYQYILGCRKITTLLISFEEWNKMRIP